MKIGLVVPGFSADECDWCIPALRHLVRELAQADEIFVLALRYPHRVGRYACFGAEVQALGGGTKRWGYSAAVWGRALAVLAAEHRRGRFDVLHAFWANEGGALTALAGRALGVPTVVSLGGGELVGFADIRYGGQLSRSERGKTRIALTQANAVTAGSSSLLERAAPWPRGRPAGQVQRIPLGVETSLFCPAPTTKREGPPRLVHVASLLPIKEQRILLEAAAHLHARGVRFELDIVGEGPEEQRLRALANELGIAGIVHFRGAIPHDQLPDLYRAGSLFVLTSRFESQCMAVLEAAACGVPTVGTSVGVVPELAPDAAVAVRIGDAQALAEAIAALLADPARLASMGRAARARVEAEYSLERCVERFRQLYAPLVAPQTAPSSTEERRLSATMRPRVIQKSKYNETTSRK
jgi:glycosyltransferase involved in cell wall biosynthesis